MTLFLSPREYSALSGTPLDLAVYIAMCRNDGERD